MTDTSYEPITNFGIQWEELLLGAGEDMTARMPSSVRSRAHIDAVLATAEVTRAVVRGDAAAVLRMSGVATDASSLVELKERTIEKVLAKQALEARGLATVQQRLRTTAPNAPQEPARLPPLATRVTAGESRALPVVATAPLGQSVATVEPMANETTTDGATAHSATADGATADGAAAALTAMRDAPDAPDGAGAAPQQRVALRAARGSEQAAANAAERAADNGARLRARQIAAKAAKAAKNAARAARRAGGAPTTTAMATDDTPSSDGEISES